MMVRCLTAEALGTMFLLAAVVGSGIMGERLAGGNVALVLLANTIATGTALMALILTFAAISGAHFNPVVTLVEALRGRLQVGAAVAYMAAQMIGAVGGVAAAHIMFGTAIFAPSGHVRSGAAQLASECFATFGLVGAILGCARSEPRALPFAVGAYITGAYWFTASTSFANPAVTVGRAMTDSFSGIRPTDVLGFIGAQLVGGLAAYAVFSWLIGNTEGVERENEATRDVPL